MIWGQPYIDANRLYAAIERELSRNTKPDFRTRLLIRDAVNALESFYGKRTFDKRLKSSEVRESVESIMQEDLGEPGFHNIRSRLVENTQRTQLAQLFELIGRKIHSKTEICIAGSIPTLIEGLTARPTDDIDIVDEIPSSLREQRELLDQIATKYGFTFGHVQSHYLPTGWRDRLQHFGTFGKLSVHVVDIYDIFVSKLSSKQEKHLDDLRVLSGRLNKDTVKQRLLNDGHQFLESPFDRPTIEQNWQFLYQEPLTTNL